MTEAPPAFLAGLAGWRCRIEADTPEGRARLMRVFEPMRLPGNPNLESRLSVLLRGENGPRLRLTGSGRPYSFSELAAGPEWKRFRSLPHPARCLYADVPMGEAPALEACGEELRVLDAPRWPLYALLGFLMLLLHEHPAVSFHAATCAVEEHALLLAGPSGSGKSTLAWALQQAGADCFGDELAFFTLPDYRLDVLRKGLCLRPGGAAALQLAPETLSWYEAKPDDPKWSAPLETPRRSCPQGRGSLFFMEGFGERPSLRHLGGGEAARRLLRGMGYGDPSIGARLEAAGGLVQRFPCWGLMAGPPAETAELLLRHARGLP